MSVAAIHMDRMYRHQRHIYDASRKFYLLGRDDLIHEVQPPRDGAVLEIGCGTARNLIRAARVYPDATFHGVDVSAAMLDTARKSIAAAGLSDRVRVGFGDATTFDPAPLFGVRRFERVFISYSLSMIPPWREALAHGLDLVAPRGSLHVVDFGAFDALPAWFGAGMRAWLRAFSVIPREDFETVFLAMSAQRAMRARVVRRRRGYAVHGVTVAPAAGGGEVAHDRHGSRGFEGFDARVRRG